MALRAARFAPVRAEREQRHPIGPCAGQHGDRPEIRSHLGKNTSRARATCRRSKDSYDPVIATELWESSASMVKLAPDEDDSAAQIDPVGSIRVPRNTYIVSIPVFSVDYISIGLTLVTW